MASQYTRPSHQPSYVSARTKTACREDGSAEALLSAPKVHSARKREGLPKKISPLNRSQASARSLSEGGDVRTRHCFLRLRRRASI